jgi:hypothetical protein
LFFSTFTKDPATFQSKDEAI